jgi:leucyl aminopeptidase (aminopeptidase T)
MEMVVRCLTADYGSIAALTKRVAEKLSRGSKFKVESELGTSLELERQDRTVGADAGLLTQRGDFGNLPAGEAFFAPMDPQMGEGLSLVAIFVTYQRPKSPTIRP